MEGSWCCCWFFGGGGGGGREYSVVPLLFVSPQTRNNFFGCTFSLYMLDHNSTSRVEMN